jgi:hypothetical protein
VGGHSEHQLACQWRSTVHAHSITANTINSDHHVTTGQATVSATCLLNDSHHHHYHHHHHHCHCHHHHHHHHHAAATTTNTTTIATVLQRQALWDKPPIRLDLHGKKTKMNEIAVGKPITKA